MSAGPAGSLSLDEVARLFAGERAEHDRREAGVAELERAIEALDESSAAFSRKVAALALCQTLGVPTRLWPQADAVALAPTTAERLAAWNVLGKHMGAGAVPAQAAA